MESLFSEFTFLSDKALQDKSFDPSTIEDLMKLFEIESYKAWAKLELQHEDEVEVAQDQLKVAEDYLDSVMESAMSEFYSFEEVMKKVEREEHDSLVRDGDRARRLGNSLEKAASFASNKYVEAAMRSATASMRSALKAVSSRTKKVHPS